MNLGYKFNQGRGFTLIELAVVIAIIGVLAGAAIFSIRQNIVSASRARSQAVLSQIKSAYSMYVAATGHTPQVAADFATISPILTGNQTISLAEIHAIGLEMSDECWGGAGCYVSSDEVSIGCDLMPMSFCFSGGRA